MRIACCMHYIFIDSSISDQQFELFNDNRVNKEEKMVSLAAFLKVVNINNKWAQKPKFNIQNFAEIFHKIDENQHFCH